MNQKGFTRGWVAALLFFLIVSVVTGGFCWPYTINSWCEYFGRRPVVTFSHGAALGAVPVLGQLALPGAVITWVSIEILEEETEGGEK